MSVTERRKIMIKIGIGKEVENITGKILKDIDRLFERLNNKVHQ